MEGFPLIAKNYTPGAAVYAIRLPEIISGSTYYFTSDSGLVYQVSFGRKKNNYLGNIINFSVISEEFEDEYSETNKGDVFKIVATMIEVVRIFHSHHPFSLSYEFSGEYKENEKMDTASIRTRLFLRAINHALDFGHWGIKREHNKVIVIRKNKND